MKIYKLIIIFTLIFSLLPGAASAGLLTLGAKASIYTPPEVGANPTLMYGFVLDYDINEIFHARAGASYTSYSVHDDITDTNINYTLMPITLNLIAHFIPGGAIDPYIGGGIGYYSKTTDSVESSHTGGQAVAGINIKTGGINVAFEAAFIDPDLSDSIEGSMSWGGWATGTSYVFIPF